jgi:hypothetical protein
MKRWIVRHFSREYWEIFWVSVVCGVLLIILREIS